MEVSMFAPSDVMNNFLLKKTIVMSDKFKLLRNYTSRDFGFIFVVENWNFNHLEYIS